MVQYNMGRPHNGAGKLPDKFIFYPCSNFLEYNSQSWFLRRSYFVLFTL